jgi:hypothetical protein
MYVMARERAFQPLEVPAYPIPEAAAGVYRKRVPRANEGPEVPGYFIQVTVYMEL